MPDNSQQIDQETANHAVLQSIHHTHKALADIKNILEAQSTRVAVGGTAIDQDVEDWPVPGQKRKALSDRRASGTDSFPATATVPLLVVEANPGRFGGRIVNIGSNLAILYLTRPERITSISAGNPAIGLAASGTAGDFWDFHLGDVPWGGPVSVISTAGTTLTVVQY